METAHVEEFLVLAEERNYWRAAERLYMNQSTLSKHIRTLEAALEGALFTRTTRSVELTEYGRAFLPHARELVRVQGACSAELRRLREVQTSTVKLHCIPVLAQYGLARLLVGFHRAYPQLALQVEETDSQACLKALEQQECELALCWEMDPEICAGMGKPLVRVPFVQERLILTVSREHPLAERGTVALRELRESDICLFKRYPAQLAIKACERAGFALRQACTTDAISNILDVLREENHVALLPERLIRYTLESAPLLKEDYRLIELEEKIEMGVSLFYLDDGSLSPAPQQFLEFFSSWMENHSSSQ